MKKIVLAGIFLSACMTLSTGCATLEKKGVSVQSDPAETFVSAERVHQFIASGNNGNRYVIAEVSWGPTSKAYDQAHIPGAIHINTDEIEYDLFKQRSGLSAGTQLGRSTTARQDRAKGLSEDAALPRNWWNIYPDAYLLPAFADMGIDTDTRVIVYGEDITAAARLAWALLYAGVQQVHLLDGGMGAWKAAGYDVSTTPAEREPVASFGPSRALHPEYLATVGHIRKVVTGQVPHALVADIRTKEEYDGLSAPYSYIPTKGRIKGARWGHAGKGPWTMESYLNPDGTLKDLTEIEQMWASEGITRESEVSFHCGTGWRSSLTFVVARAMGWQRIRNFDGSWYQWSMGPEASENPVETGYSR